jgi:hypothetical protein
VSATAKEPKLTPINARAEDLSQPHRGSGTPFDATAASLCTTALRVSFDGCFWGVGGRRRVIEFYVRPTGPTSITTPVVGRSPL